MRLIPIRSRDDSVVAWAKVDDEDYEDLAQFRWTLHNWGYAKRSYYQDGQGFTEMMARRIMQAKPGESVDHENRDKLDNRRENLRSATGSEQQWNQGKRMPGKTTSRFKGVSWSRQAKGWRAFIRVHYKGIYLGKYSSEVEAALAYDEAAGRLHGEFAVLNFPQVAA